MSYLLCLPWPPSVNDYYFRNKRGMVCLSREAKQYKELAAVAGGTSRKPLAGKLAVRIWAWFPDRHRRDLDNILKAILDAGTICNVWGDDSQIGRLTVEHAGYCQDGKVIVYAEVMDKT